MVDSAQLKAQIQDFWHGLAGNPANRARIVARIAVNHGDADIMAWAYALIQHGTTDYAARTEALRLLKPPSPAYPAIEIVEEIPPTPEIVSPPPSSPTPTASLGVRVDPDLGRLTVALHVASLFRLWVVGRDVVRRGNGSGQVAKASLKDALAAEGVTYSKGHFNHLLRQGAGLFWDLDHTCKRLFLRAPKPVARQLTRRALALDLGLIDRDPPGVRDVYLSPAGSHEQWEAMIYAGWMADRNHPTIARETLERLFRRDQDTLRRWEQQCLDEMLTIRKNYAQLANPQGEFYDLIPEHAESYLAQLRWKGQITEAIRIYWRLPNTYQVQGIRQHPHKGQASKVRKVVNEELDQFSDEQSAENMPAAVMRGGLPKIKLYFNNEKALRRYVRKHGGFGYAWRGENRHGHGMFEPCRNGYVFTHAKERAGYKREYDHLKKGVSPEVMRQWREGRRRMRTK